MSFKDTTIKFSPIIIGTMRLGKWGANMTTKELEYFIDACLDLGLKDFDHADIYGNYTEEAAFGVVLKKRPEWRNKMQLTTKCGIKMVTPNRPAHQIKSYDSGSKHILSSVENSLRVLSTDHIDLLLLHRPDYLMHPEEVATAFELLRSQGKVSHFGVSNFSVSQVNLLKHYTPLVSHQIEVSLSHLDPFDNGILDQCLQHKIVPTAWSPYGGGSLFNEGSDPDLIRIQKSTSALAKKYDVTTDQVMLAFLMRHPSGIIPVMGTTKVSRIASAIKATELKLTKEDWYTLWQAATGTEVP